MSTDPRARAWVDVSASALRANFRRIQEAAGPQGRVIPMVKANAYGLGMKEALETLKPLDPWAIGVAAVSEGVAVRELGVTKPVVVFSPVPPGSYDEALAWDLSLALSAQRDFPLGEGKGSLWGGFGGTWLGDGDVLEDEVEDFAANGWLGAGWAPAHWLALKLQIDSHTALYDSDLTELGDPAVILTMGGTLGFGERTALDIGIGEDLNVNASPDVTFHLNLTHEF